MRYVLMLHAPRGNGDYHVMQWAPEELKAHIQYMQGINRDLTAAGELVAAEGLAPPGAARIVRAGDTGLPVVTDGPFAESKEFLAGFWMIDVENEARVHEIAARASMAPGPGGKPLHMPIEIRQVLRAPSFDE